MHTTRLALAAIIAAGLAGALTACSRAEPAASATPTDKGPAAELRIGHLPNITHAAALIGLERGYFAKELGSTKLTTQTFNAGPEAVGALLGNSLDISFIGPGPAINAFAKSDGRGVRIIAGATSGGAQLVVRPGIDSPEALRGKQVATPQLGNTQDIALKKWLSDKGIQVGAGTDQVAVVNSDNPQTLDAFRTGEIDAAWLPEPWASRLVLDAGATVLLDEHELWPDGRFPTTVVIARTRFLHEHPQTVQAFLRGHLAAIDWAGTNQAEAKAVTNAALKALTGKSLPDPVIERSFANLTLTADPLASRFPQLARDAVTAGVSSSAPDLEGLVNLGPLNAVLTAAGRPAVDAAGLDTT